MNEKTVVKRSYIILLVGCVIFSIMGIFLRDISYVLGFILGYMLNLVIFHLTIKSSDMMISLSSPIAIVIMTFILKFLLYALGFMIAIKIKWFHLAGVFFGYLTIKISIYVEAILNKGGE